MTLIRHHLKTEWISLAIWTLLMGGMVYGTTFFWKFMSESGALNDLEAMMASVPASVRAVYGVNAQMATLQGWLQGFSLGGFLSIPYSIFTGLFAAGLITREMDRRTMEFLLSLPVARWQVVVSRWAGMVLALAVMHLAQFGAVLAAVSAIGGEVPAGEVATASLNSWLLFVAMGSLLLLVSLFLDDYGRGVSVLIGMSLGLYLLHGATGDATGALKTLRGLLPFAFYTPSEIIGTGNVPVADMLTLVGMGLGALGLSAYLFQRKQISV